MVLLSVSLQVVEIPCIVFASDFPHMFNPFLLVISQSLILLNVLVLSRSITDPETS